MGAAIRAAGMRLALERSRFGQRTATGQSGGLEACGPVRVRPNRGTPPYRHSSSSPFGSHLELLSMKVKAGVWIDHRKALIVLMTADGERAVLIVSHVEKHLQRSGDLPLKGRYEAQQVPADDCREKALTAELNIFYDAVIAVLRSAESYIILGPGEAKGELKKRLVTRKLGGRLTATMVADKMSDRQIAAKVREHFSAPWSAKGPKAGRPNAGLRGQISPARSAR